MGKENKENVELSDIIEKIDGIEERISSLENTNIRRSFKEKNGVGFCETCYYLTPHKVDADKLARLLRSLDSDEAREKCTRRERCEFYLSHMSRYVKREHREDAVIQNKKGGCESWIKKEEEKENGS